MNRQTLIEVVVFVLLVAAGALLRISLEYLPNFAPVAALALFAGYFFRSRAVALCVPLSIMLLSDLRIGFYEPYQMAVVYGMLALPVLMRGVLRRNLNFGSGRLRAALVSLAGLLACSFVSSVLFFVATNAVCLRWYEPTLAGVLHCYAAALPFFRYTLAGDMGFAMLTFGSYALVMSLAPATVRQKQQQRLPQASAQAHPA